MTRAHRSQNSYYAGDLYGELSLFEQSDQKRSLRDYVPGLAVAGIAAMAAGFIHATYGMPLILAGLVLGLALTFAAQNSRTHAGLDLASGTILKAGIVLLGFQVTAAEIIALGAAPFAAVMLVMVAAMLGALTAAKMVGQTREAGLLAGGATGICGASAALAIYGVIGDRRISKTQFTIALMGITAASATALVLYPIVAQWLEFTDRQAGFLMGAAVHDVAQAIGGGYSISNEAGEQATVVKLSRVAMLGPLVALLALWMRKSSQDHSAIGHNRPALMPPFILAFLAVLLLNSLIDVPTALRAHALTAAKTMLLLAVIATAMRSNLALLLEAGWRTFLPVIGATIMSFATALALAIWLI